MDHFFLLLGLALCLVPCHGILYINQLQGKVALFANGKRISTIASMQDLLPPGVTLDRIQFGECTENDLTQLPLSFYKRMITREQISDIEGRSFYDNADSLSNIRKTLKARGEELKDSTSGGHSFDHGSSSEHVFWFEDIPRRNGNKVEKTASETKDPDNGTKEESRSRASSGPSWWKSFEEKWDAGSNKASSSSESLVTSPGPHYRSAAPEHLSKRSPNKPFTTATTTTTTIGSPDEIDVLHDALIRGMWQLEIGNIHAKDAARGGDIRLDSGRYSTNGLYESSVSNFKEEKRSRERLSAGSSSSRKKAKSSDGSMNEKTSFGSRKVPRQEDLSNVPKIIETKVDPMLPLRQEPVDWNRLSVPEDLHHKGTVLQPGKRFRSVPITMPNILPETDNYRNSFMPFSMELPRKMDHNQGRNLSRTKKHVRQ
ncbi:hypothetical protein PSACC_02278 [Paramicrosporidium saccamoebae]|uniref:Uncharacterized protein n=1 Tax=Paramicrosporidium saccamoebae TaxID=1246581 RepID=A0A2H9TJN9_9FUNG|nr:hypothetical protein PSACC_02278 [Paramicrosporidium saccamoebae]